MDGELSGEKWGRKFPGSTKTKDLSEVFVWQWKIFCLQ